MMHAITLLLDEKKKKKNLNLRWRNNSECVYMKKHGVLSKTKMKMHGAVSVVKNIMFRREKSKLRQNFSSIY